ncbi:hypothetical protein KW782_04085 [Candidatus Parcubacteria bacterium]|nr:hypothetical protein [Candidatus Parcubacteria bacterium]
MTLISAIVDRSKTVHMMSDSITSYSSGAKSQVRFPKATIKKDPRTGERFVIGASGEVSINQLCLETFVPPDLPPAEADVYKWCINEFREKLWKILKDADKLNKDKEGQSMIPGSIILGLRGSIFCLDGYLAIIAVDHPYNAVGSGNECCCGALHVSLKGNQTPPPSANCRTHLLAAMRAATYHRSGIGPPFHYINTRGEKKTFEK